jgi:hypothetical protein
VQHDRGLPLGNMTSQLFGNAYMDGLDHFVKERLRIRWYARFCDDFLIVHPDRIVLEEILSQIRTFLLGERALELHPREKVTIRRFSYGIDCVGWVLRPHVRTLRRTTIRRAFRTICLRTDAYLGGRIIDIRYCGILQSFLGLCAWGANHRVRQRICEMVWRAFHYRRDE